LILPEVQQPPQSAQLARQAQVAALLARLESKAAQARLVLEAREQLVWLERQAQRD
jgi:hypothetical protein